MSVRSASFTNSASAATTLRIAPVAVGYFLGDYIGLTGTDENDDGASDAFVAFFAQSNNIADPATIYSPLVSPQP